MSCETKIPQLETARCRLRAWRDSDLAPFAGMNSDPRVMEFFPALLSRQESDAMAGRIKAQFASHGWGLWALEIVASRKFAGFVGLNIPKFEASFTPCVEVGWRLAHEFWGKGYAPEAALAALDYGFGELALPEILSMTTVANLKSRRVMEKLGMSHVPSENFEHPAFPPEHPMRSHVLYRLDRHRHEARKREQIPMPGAL